MLALSSDDGEARRVGNAVTPRELAMLAMTQGLTPARAASVEASSAIEPAPFTALSSVSESFSTSHFCAGPAATSASPVRAGCSTGGLLRVQASRTANTHAKANGCPRTEVSLGMERREATPRTW